MRTMTWICGGVLALIGAVARGETTVVFDHPERFADAGEFGRDTSENLAVLERKLQALDQRYLAPGDMLQITITDVDLAGRTRFVRSAPNEIRVLNGGADWPLIKLRYTWTSGGKTVGPVEESVTDQNYLAFGPRPDLSEPLPYERRMLERWFKERFVDRKPPPRRQ